MLITIKFGKLSPLIFQNVEWNHTMHYLQFLLRHQLLHSRRPWRHRILRIHISCSTELQKYYFSMKLQTTPEHIATSLKTYLAKWVWIKKKWNRSRRSITTASSWTLLFLSLPENWKSIIFAFKSTRLYLSAAPLIIKVFRTCKPASSSSIYKASQNIWTFLVRSDS